MASLKDILKKILEDQQTAKMESSTITDTSKSQREKLVTNFMNDIDESNSLLHRTLNSNGYFTARDIKESMNSKFYRFPRHDPYNYVDGAREYLFFTKPDLPLVESPYELTDEANRIPYLNNLFRSEGYRDSVFKNLCKSGFEEQDKCPFMRILSNRKTSNMDVPDIQVEELETAVNMFGSRILYPKSSMLSDENHAFTVEFEDTRFLEIYNLFKVWDIYEQCKWLGALGPTVHLLRKTGNPNEKSKAYSRYADYCFYRVLNDHIRVFKFLVDNDGETILHMSSAIGCYVSSISRTSFSEIQERGPLKISVGFKISGWFEDNDPSIAVDFNLIVADWLGYKNPKEMLPKIQSGLQPIFDSDIGEISQEAVEVPFIYEYKPASTDLMYGSRLDKFYTYKLLWMKEK